MIFFPKIFSNLLKCDGLSKHILLWWLWYLIATISYNWYQGNRTRERMDLFPFNCWRITPEIIWWGSILIWSALINIFSIPVTNSLCVCFLNLKIFKSHKIFLIKVLFFIFSWTWIKTLRVKSKEREELIVQTLWGHLFPWTHFAKQNQRTRQDSLPACAITKYFICFYCPRSDTYCFLLFLFVSGTVNLYSVEKESRETKLKVHPIV